MIIPRNFPNYSLWFELPNMFWNYSSFMCACLSLHTGKHYPFCKKLLKIMGYFICRELCPLVSQSLSPTTGHLFWIQYSYSYFSAASETFMSKSITNVLTKWPLIQSSYPWMILFNNNHASWPMKTIIRFLIYMNNKHVNNYRMKVF